MENSKEYLQNDKIIANELAGRKSPVEFKPPLISQLLPVALTV